MVERVEYGLPQIDMGDWERGKDNRMGKFIENQVTGFRVYFYHQNPIHDGRLRYIVSKDEFSIGFAAPGAQAGDNSGGYRHVPIDENGTPPVVIDTVGGTFRSDMCTETKHFPVLAATTKFVDHQQQNAFLAALADAVPRIPALGTYALRWNGGFWVQSGIH
jgi:hypothetical protein